MQTTTTITDEFGYSRKRLRHIVVGDQVWLGDDRWATITSVERGIFRKGDFRFTTDVRTMHFANNGTTLRVR